MIKNFETKYRNILEAKTKDLTSSQKSNTETKGNQAENRTQNYYLDRKASNQFLNGTKVILFAIGLSLVNPIQVDAQDVNEKIGKEEISYSNPTSMVSSVYIGGCILTSIGFGFYIKNLKKRNKYQSYDIKLFDDTKIDEEEAMKHIKIICK